MLNIDMGFNERDVLMTTVNTKNGKVIKVIPREDEKNTNGIG